MGRVLWRGVRRRCPVCGSKGIFAGYFKLADCCPGCGYSFEREEGYWVGAMIVNFAAAELAFAAVLGAGIALTWPEVPWTLLMVVGVTTMVAVPIVFYPYSKSLWVAGDYLLNPPKSERVPGGPPV
jgi:uncharacterized protein (DUF983 family)